MDSSDFLDYLRVFHHTTSIDPLHTWKQLYYILTFLFETFLLYQISAQKPTDNAPILFGEEIKDSCQFLIVHRADKMFDVTMPDKLWN